MSAGRRGSVKKVGGGNWKERLRSECFQRLRQERQRILWAARGDQQAVQTALGQLISSAAESLDAQAVTQPLQHGGTPGASYSSSAGGASPATPATAAVAIAATAGAVGWVSSRTPGPGPSRELHQLEGEDYEELMRALEASLLEDRLAEEAAYLEGLDTQEVVEAVEAYYSVGEMPQAAGPSEEGQHPVPCPLCQQSALVQHRGVILCPRGDLRLDVALEHLTLEHLRQRLATALDAHRGRGCCAAPAFGLQQHGASGVPGGGSLLCMACQQCGCFEVVL